MTILISTSADDDQSSLVVDGGVLAPIGGGGSMVNSGPGGPVASTYVISSGQTSQYTLTSGDTLSVLSGGVDSGSRVDSGATVSILSGRLSEDDIVSGGILIVSGNDSGGVAVSAATLLSGATMSVLGGSLVGGNTFDPGATLFLSGADAQSRDDVFQGAQVVVGSGGQTDQDVFEFGTIVSYGSGAAAEIDSISSGAVASFISGAEAAYDEVWSGGEVFLASGAVASSDQLDSGGIVGVAVPFGSGEIVSYDPGSETLTVASGGISQTVVFGSVQSSSHLTSAAAPGGGTLVTFACFAGGTRIATPSGETPVERLREGDLVRTVSGAACPVRWIGYRRLRNAASVRVHADAFGAGRPARDLVLSPEHAVYIEGVLIPIRHLIDDVAITEERAAEITYWHVELDSHDVLLADGLPCESWLDTGNRAMFENAAVPDLRPSFMRGASTSAYAPVVEHGALIAIARQKLAGRRQVRDVVLPPCGTVRIDIAAGIRSIRLISASGRGLGDARRRGALIRAIRLDGAVVSLDDSRLVRGFHAIEQHGEAAVRWTDGAGVIAVACARMLEVDVAAAFAQAA